MAASGQQNTQRKAIFSDRHKQIEQKIQEDEVDQKASRQLVIRRSRLELLTRFSCDYDSRNRGINPFFLCSEYDWDVIFAYLTESADLLNCMRTCSQFEGMLWGRRTRFEFFEVFGFLVDKLSFKDILNCRLACTSWKLDVDKTLEGAYVPRWAEIYANAPYTRSPIKTFVLKCPYTFTIQFSDPQEIAKNERRVNVMKSHRTNPLVGKRVYIKVELLTADEKALMEPMVKELLSDFGPNLLHLKLFIIPLLFHPRIYWGLICHALNVCKSLKTLHLRALGVRVEFANLTENELNFDVDDLPCCMSLESLHMPGRSRTERTIQGTLIRKYSSQLKVLTVFFWNADLYQQLPWQKLRCLEVWEGRSMIDGEYPNTVNSIRLQELFLNLSLTRELQFRQVMPAINRFPVLRTCTLNLSASHNGLGSDQFLKAEEISGLMYSETITCLNLCLQVLHECDPSFDFLIFFPHVKHLNIETEEFRRRHPFIGFIRGERPHDFVQLAQHICEKSSNGNDSNVEPMYRSNIWQVLTRLQTLGITRNIYIERANNKQRVVYTRKAYEVARVSV